MKSPRLRMLMLAVIAAGPLASAPALAQGNHINLWNWWNQFVQWIQTNTPRPGPGSPGNGTPLPAPGMLGLVVVGLGSGIFIARRRKSTAAE